MNWCRRLKDKVKTLEPLKAHTSFKIGGPVRFFAEPEDIEDLRLLISSAKKYRIPIFLIGAGTNLLISDKGINGIAVKLGSSFFKRIFFNSNHLEAGSGVLLPKLIQEAQKQGLSGVEFLSGIPGTVGGALAGNAGAWGKNIADYVENVSVMDYNGKIKVLPKNKITFEYRNSSLRKFIILGASLRLLKYDKDRISRRIKGFLRRRRLTQDNSLPNAGCIFKNPPGNSSGRLIDLCGLKGKRIGRAGVSLRHANFILNQGNARASDVLKLMRLLKKKVKDRFGIILEPEIKIWR